MIELTQEELEILTDAFTEKAKMVYGETPEERERAIVQMVIVDTYLTCDGSISVEMWKSGA